jgi:hypothetical protein
MADNFSSLLESFKNLGVSRAYGAPVQIGGEELIPVALVSFGFGGGSDAADRGGASGGGGGGLVLPLGVYRNVGGHIAFRPNTIAVLVCLVPVVSAVGVAVRRALPAVRT